MAKEMQVIFSTPIFMPVVSGISSNFLFLILAKTTTTTNSTMANQQNNNIL